MASDTKKIKGKSGCSIQATPATIYAQFEQAYSAYLFYDFVLMHDLKYCVHLHEHGDYARVSMFNAFQQLVDHGIVLEPTEHFSVPFRYLSEEDFREFYPISAERFPKDLNFINQKYADLCAAVSQDELLTHEMRVEVGKPEHVPLVIPKKYQQQKSELSGKRSQARSSYEKACIRIAAFNHGYNLDDGTMQLLDGSRNEELRPVIVKGRAPLLGSAVASGPLTDGQEFRTFRLVLKNVPFPSDMPIDEYIEFRHEKSVRHSVGSFRDLADDLINGQAPAAHVVEEIMGRYEEYKEMVERSKVKKRVADVSFIISNVAGFAEDLIKLRLESLSKRPFEIAKFIADRNHQYRELERSPFFFLYAKDSSVNDR